MKIYIKNMVCPRCILAVEQLFHEIDVNLLDIKLGEVNTVQVLTKFQYNILKERLGSLGFELLDDVKDFQINQIKSVIINQIQNSNGYKIAFSEIISHSLNKEYSQLSKLFSVEEGITIENFIIRHKIEKVKELLVDKQLNLNEISDKMGYSSVAHLSSQFKKIVGMSPTAFKKQEFPLRKGIDSL
ncbi:MAG: helix-turn-helix transcriptional regulator [Flavobacteriia bacterium]|nr:helix-turn-helix transcriptional regulator [Flavobacteriia bacterium]